MRFPEEQIRRAILHPLYQVRFMAMTYFSESDSADESIMPLVIQAITRYGEQADHMLLPYARRLRQTPATVDWLISMLQRPIAAGDTERNRVRNFLAHTLIASAPELLARRHKDILAAPAFPEELKPMLGEILRMEFCDWPTLWEMFLDLGRQTLDGQRMTADDHRRFHHLVRAMARYPADGAATVLELLRPMVPGQVDGLTEWLRPKLVELAGRMGLTESVPLLMNSLDDEPVAGEVGTALMRIGGDPIIDAVAEAWPKTNAFERITLCEPLEGIHSDLALQTGLDLLGGESDEELRLCLACAVLRQFSAQSIEPVRQVLLEWPGQGGDYWDVRYRLIATAMIMGQTFPEYDAWLGEAVTGDFGWKRVSDLVERVVPATPPVEESLPVRRIRPRTRAIYQFKVKLKQISPPIWRRLLVPDCTLDDLHEILQIVMGWEHYHLYAFEVAGREFAFPEEEDDGLDMEDATRIYLSQVLHREDRKFVYVYDFGDDWRHELVVEQVGRAQPGQVYPQCLQGKRACPPEDVGGHWGYADYLEALSDPEHDRHRELLKWRGPFDAETFDLDAVNRALRKAFE